MLLTMLYASQACQPGLASSISLFFGYAGVPLAALHGDQLAGGGAREIVGVAGEQFGVLAAPRDGVGTEVVDQDLELRVPAVQLGNHVPVHPPRGADQDRVGVATCCHAAMERVLGAPFQSCP